MTIEEFEEQRGFEKLGVAASEPETTKKRQAYSGPGAHGMQSNLSAGNQFSSEQGEIAAVIHRATRGQGGWNADATLRDYVHEQTGGMVQPANDEELEHAGWFSAIQDQIIPEREQFSSRQEGFSDPLHHNRDVHAEAGQEPFSLGAETPDDEKILDQQIDQLRRTGDFNGAARLTAILATKRTQRWIDSAKRAAAGFGTQGLNPLDR